MCEWSVARPPTRVPKENRRTKDASLHASMPIPGSMKQCGSTNLPPASDELEGAGGDFGAGCSHADDDALSPAPGVERVRCAGPDSRARGMGESGLGAKGFGFWGLIGCFWRRRWGSLPRSKHKAHGAKQRERERQRQRQRERERERERENHPEKDFRNGGGCEALSALSSHPTGLECSGGISGER
jgi:hypothetical protein